MDIFKYIYIINTIFNIIGQRNDYTILKNGILILAQPWRMEGAEGGVSCGKSMSRRPRRAELEEAKAMPAAKKTLR
ncbi:hypothetical protein D7Z54_20265 [Salibacterium salarium]|uniref:Uncharacterized protein n=1 Tax=Salibacterium salarium TaxID=284579 RepID=A0A3R9P2P3_9BACI|nr:hypothetical protein D7Z54_20265 [Salibacterium salarium]